MAKRQIKYALVLSGGGFLGAYEVGALNYINQHWTQITGLDEPMVFDIVSGISVGSLNGVMAAQGKMNELNELWSLVAEHGGSEIFTSDYIDERGNFKLNFEALKKDLFPGFTVQTRYFFRGIWNVFMKLFGKDLPSFFELIIRDITAEVDKNLDHFKALAKNKPLRDKLNDIVDLQDFPAKTTFQCGFVSLDTGIYTSVNHTDIPNNKTLVDSIIASTSIPVVWEPVAEINYNGLKKNLSDGGLKNVSPMADAVKTAKEDSDYDYRFIIINCHSENLEPENEKPWNVFSAGARSFAIIMAEIFKNDLNRFIKKNKIARENQATARAAKLVNFDCHIVQPETENLGSSLDTSARAINERKVKGYAKAKEVFEKNYSG